jgi:large subunit ribosomal protein L6
MSRIGNKPLQIPSGVQVDVSGDTIKVKGPKGELRQAGHGHVHVKLEGSTLTVTVSDEEDKKDRSLWGLYRRLIENMVEGVTKGFERKLEINGVGYRASVSGKVLKVDAGYSHDVDFPIPDGIQIAAEKNVITVTGIDKQLVGETAARIRKIRKPEPYLGKGIKYMDEVIARKAGKTAKSA